MGELSVFLRENKRKKSNFFFAPTDSICGSDGKPVVFEFKHLTSTEDRLIRDECYTKGKFNSMLYMRKMLAACVVYPDLHNAELLDSYGVNKPEELLECLVDSPAQWDKMSIKIQQELGFLSPEEAIEEAKK